MAINWRQEADIIINTSELFADLTDMTNSEQLESDAKEYIREIKGNYGTFGIIKYEHSQPGKFFISFDYIPIRQKIKSECVAFVQIHNCKTKEGIFPKEWNEPAYDQRRTNSNWVLDRNSPVPAEILQIETGDTIWRPYKKFYRAGKPVYDSIGTPKTKGVLVPAVYRKKGWYGYNDDGTTIPTDFIPGSSTINAFFEDEPGKSNAGSEVDGRVYQFEVYAIDKAGNDGNNMKEDENPKHKIYDGLYWGFSMDGNICKPIKARLLSKPSADFKEAVEAWNAQANLEDDKLKNAPDQEVLPNFRW